MSESAIHDADRTKPDSAPLLLSIPEAAETLRISRWALYQLINKRRLKTVRIRSRRLVAPVDLAVLIEELRREGGE
jgi:excisionase family DNA binding protein